MINGVSASIGVSMARKTLRLWITAKENRMMNNKIRPIHPGEILREEYLLTLGMTANALSIALRVPAPRINELVRERRGISTDTALRLARFFNTTPQFWLNLQTSFDLKHTEMAVGERILHEIHPLQVAA
jgi:antitoxin HigA-1